MNGEESGGAAEGRPSLVRLAASGRGQVGIGTLIVFIAMILVATITAGVLIETTGAFESTVAETGDESRQQVTNRLRVVGTTGTVTDGEPTIGAVELVVTTTSDAGAVNLADTTVRHIGSGGVHDLVYVESYDGTNPQVGAFDVVALEDPDGSAPAVTGSRDRLVIQIDLGNRTLENSSAEPVGDPLAEGTRAEVQLTTPQGATTVERITVPQSLTGEDTVAL